MPPKIRRRSTLTSNRGFKMIKSFALLSLGLFAVFLTACTLNEASGAQTQSWIDAPLNNSTLPLAPVKVISHSSNLAGISQVELSVNGTIISNDKNQDTSQSLIVMDQTWTPSAPGSYTLQVRAQSTSGQWSDYAVVNITVENAPSATLTPMETFTPTPTATSIITPTSPTTPTPSAPSLTLGENAFCRKGPDPAFPDVTAIPKGDIVDIQGVSQDGFWYFVFWQQFNVKCWVAAHAGQVNGNVQGVPVLVSQSTATPKPTLIPTYPQSIKP